MATSGFLRLLQREEVSGMNKIGYYMGSTRTINVASYEICPVSYNF